MIAYTDADYRDIDLRAYDAKNGSTLDPKKNKDVHVTTKTTKTTYAITKDAIIDQLKPQIQEQIATIELLKQ